LVLGTYADDALGADDLDELVGHGALGVALGIRLDVAEVTNVAVLVGRGAVCLAVRVDCRVPQCQRIPTIGRPSGLGTTGGDIQ
jgi:hypothetical protein